MAELLTIIVALATLKALQSLPGVVLCKVPQLSPPFLLRDVMADLVPCDNS